jgi:hypothetical protein
MSRARKPWCLKELPVYPKIFPLVLGRPPGPDNLEIEFHREKATIADLFLINATGWCFSGFLPVRTLARALRRFICKVPDKASGIEPVLVEIVANRDRHLLVNSNLPASSSVLCADGPANQVRYSQADRPLVATIQPRVLPSSCLLSRRPGTRYFMLLPFSSIKIQYGM